jgi:hypothetical protein
MPLHETKGHKKAIINLDSPLKQGYILSHPTTWLLAQMPLI